MLVIIGDPKDIEMRDFLAARNIPFKMDSQNRGFASNVNDCYEAAFVHGNYDNLIICGNDVVPMEGALDAMIDAADREAFEMICGSEFNARFLVNNYPEARQYFHGENLVFHDFSARPWELHKERRYGLEPHQRKDVRNLTLFKRSSFEKVGFDDVNYFPNAYYADNTYCRRCDLLNVSAAGLAEACFFHFTSRTIFQNSAREHGTYSQRNHWFFREQWGGDPGHETYALPFHGDPYELAPGITLQPDLKIASREQEDAVIDYWRNKR